MYQGLFLDRDGVIIENRSDYVRSWTDVEFLPGALETLAALAALPHKIIIVTNQSLVGRGIITFAEAEAINIHILETIKKAGGRVDGLYMCPHAPEDYCQCRKPRPGLLQQAILDHNIVTERSIMVGDALTDIQAGQAAGLKDSYLVLTGRGHQQLRLPLADSLLPYHVIDSLVDLPSILISK